MVQALKHQVRLIRDRVANHGDTTEIQSLDDSFKLEVMNEIKKVDRVFSKTEQECWNLFFIRLYPRYLEVSMT
jgi:hypothetical protein